MNCGTLILNPVSKVASFVEVDDAPGAAGGVSVTTNSTLSGRTT